jgi:hypothetical protein
MLPGMTVLTTSAMLTGEATETAMKADAVAQPGRRTGGDRPATARVNALAIPVP